MKPLQLLLAMALCTVGLVAVAHAQALQEQMPAVLTAPSIKPAIEPSKLDQMLLEKNAMVTQGFTDVGTIHCDDGSSIRVRAVQARDGSDNQVLYGVLVQIQMQGGRAAQSYIDLDKLDGLVNSIDMLRTMDRSATQMADFEASYRVEGGLDIRNIEQGGTRVGEIRCLEVRYATGQIIWAALQMRLSRLDEFKRLMTVAKDKIAEAEKARASKD